MERGQIVALPTEVIAPGNTPEKKKTDTLVAHPRWKYIGPGETIRFEWQIGRWGWAGFAGETDRKYATRSQPASMELKEFSTSLPAISLSPLSPGYYDCEIWFKDKFPDLRVIIQNCVRIVEAAPPTKHFLDLWISPAGSGDVQLSPSYPDNMYEEGQRVILTARETNPDYKWLSYTGDVSSTSKIITITMDSDKWVVAQFTLKAPPQFLCPFPDCYYIAVSAEELEMHIMEAHG